MLVRFPPHNLWLPIDGALERQLSDLTASLSFISVELVPIHQRIVALRRQLAFMLGDIKLNKADFKAVLEELRKIDS